MAKQNVPSSATPVAAAAAQTAGNGVDHTPAAEAGMWARIQSMGASMGSSESAMSAKRIMVLIAKVFGYALGTAATIFAMSYMATMMLTAGWPLFLVAVIELMGYILGMLASWYLSDKVVNFIVDGGVSKTIGTVASKFAGLFRSKPVAPAVAAPAAEGA